MSISALTMVVFAANGITSLAAIALLMLVLFHAPHQRANQIFAIAMLLLGAYGAINGFSRFLDRIDLDPERVFYVATQLYGSFAVTMFFFATEFAARLTPAMRIMRWSGVVLIIVLSIALWSGVMTTNFEAVTSVDGSYRWEYTRIGTIAPSMVFMYLVFSALLLYRTEDERLRGLWRAPTLVALSAVSAIIIWPIVPIPLNAFFLAAAAFALGVPVLRHELFNPLAQYNTELAERNLELQEANRLKSQFLANMSHELRTPLNSIIGYTELVLSGTYGEMNETQQDRLEKVVRNGNHLLALINDVLDLNRIEAGRLILDRRAVDTAQLLDNAFATVKPLADSKNLPIHRDYSSAPALYGDESRLLQIVTNVISNAVKFTHEGWIKIHAARQENMVRIDISDTGIGIRPELQEEVFKEFLQADSSFTREYEGTGLGPAITQRLVQLHGGTIWLDSAVQQGTTIHMLLPAAEPVAFDKERHLQGRGETILVIDDNPDAAQMLKDTLEQAGYHIVIAASGAEGIQRARNQRPDLITLDVMMPHLDGWQVLRQLKQTPVTREIPVVVVSMIENQPLAISLGASDSFTKPVDRDHLLDTIGAELGKRTPNPLLFIVDDQQTERDLIALELRHSPFRLDFAPGGQEALEWLGQHTPDMILLDLIMPEIGGFEVLAHIRENPRLANVPVVVFTGRDLTLEEQRFLSDRCASLVHKGMAGREALLSAINQAIQRDGNGSTPKNCRPESSNPADNTPESARPIPN